MRYTVAITEEVLYEVDVEADSAEEAEAKAEAEFLNAPDPNNYFSSVAERIVAAGDPALRSADQIGRWSIEQAV